MSTFEYFSRSSGNLSRGQKFDPNVDTHILLLQMSSPMIYDPKGHYRISSQTPMKSLFEFFAPLNYEVILHEQVIEIGI